MKNSKISQGSKLSNSNSNFTEANQTELYANSSDSDNSLTFNSHISPRKITNSPSHLKKPSGKSYLDREYQRLTKKIANDEQTIAELKAENKLLKEAISRAEETIKAYPQAQKNYDRLSASINRAHHFNDSLSKRRSWN